MRASFSDKSAQRALISVANGLEMIEFGVGGDGGYQIFFGIKPERFASPNQALDCEAVQGLVFSVNADLILAARLNFHASGRKGSQFCGRTVQSPKTDHEHLHGCRSIAGDGEKLCRTRSFSPFVAVAHTDLG